MKILTLTDLSQHSKSGVIYAAKLSMVLNAKLIVMNVLNHGQLNVADSENKWLELITEVRKEIPDFNAELFIEKGSSFEETVNTFALRHRCDLIVMSTKGASGLRKIFLGSNSSAVVGANYSIPVLTVPEFAFFKGFNDIVYTSDLNRLSEEFKILLPLAKLFNATVHVLHIYQTDNIPKVHRSMLAEKLRNEFNYPKINCTYILDSEVKRGIDQYLNGRNADIIAMFSGKRSFFERIFEKSSSREMVLQSNVPLLTFSNSEAIVIVR